MAKTPDFNSSTLRVTRWSQGASRSLFLDSGFGRLFRTGAIYPDPDAGNKKAGDTITMAFLKDPSTAGIGEGGVLDGNEEVLGYEDLSFKLNESRYGVQIAGEFNIERFRTKNDFDMDAYSNIAKYNCATIDASCFQQLAGAYPTTVTVDGIDFTGNKRILVTGNNSVDAVHSDRIVRAGAKANDESLATSDTLTLDLIDVMIEKVRKTPQIAKLQTGRYDLYISPEQFTDLKRDDTGKITWFDIAKARMAGGKETVYDASRVVEATEVIGNYAGVDIIMCDRVAYGVNSSTSVAITNTRRAVLVGRDALCYASPTITSRDFSNIGAEKISSAIKVTSMLKDHDHLMAIGSSMIFGLKRKKFSNTRDSGVIVCSTYAAPHTV